MNATDPVAREHWETRIGRILELLRTQSECCLCSRELKFAGGGWKNRPVLSQRLDMLVCRSCAHDAKEAGPDVGPKLNTAPAKARNVDPADVVRLRRDRVAELHRQGYQVRQIAKLLGVNAGHVGNDLQKLGLILPRAKKAAETVHTADALIAEITEAALRTATVGEPDQGDRRDWKPDVALFEAVERTTCPVAVEVPSRRQPAAVVAERRERVLELFKQGLRVDDIAVALGITRRMIYKDREALGTRCPIVQPPRPASLVITPEPQAPKRPDVFLPTPAEIAAECLAIQSEWRAGEFARRAKGVLPKRDELLARRDRVACLKREGKGNTEIASALGVSKSIVGGDLTKLKMTKRRSRPGTITIIRETGDVAR